MDEGWQAEGGSPWLSPVRAPRTEAGPGTGTAPGGTPEPAPLAPTYAAPSSYTAPPYTAAQPHPSVQAPPPVAQIHPTAPEFQAAPTAAEAPRSGASGAPSALHPSGGTVEDAERILAQAVEAAAATPDMYALGTAADGAVCLVPEDRRWSVFLADGPVRRFAGSFDDPELAAVHFAGVLLLLAQERGTLSPAGDDYDDFDSADPSDIDRDADVAVHSDLLPTLALAPDAHADPLAAFLAGPPIEPLAGEPPATLYAERRLTVLTPGTEVDRFGDQEGNTVYAARTRFANRSLPADFADRDYRVYRVIEPLRTLTGRAIPWFGQPGGGAVYLLPRPIRELLREGLLVEISSSTVAPS